MQTHPKRKYIPDTFYSSTVVGSLLYGSQANNEKLKVLSTSPQHGAALCTAPETHGQRITHSYQVDRWIWF